MLHAAWKSLWARKVRLILSALSIVLGVAFVSGSLMFTNLLSSSFDSLIKGAFGDVNVLADGASLTDLSSGQKLITPAQADAIGDLDGVARAQGVVSTSTVYPLDKDGNLLSFPGAPGIATNWHDTPAADGLEGARIVEGRAPEADDELALDPTTARRGGYAIGDSVQVATPLDGIKTYRLVGTATYGSGSTAGASYLFFTLSEAQSILQQGRDGYSAMWIETTPDADADVVAAEVNTLLPDGFKASSGAELAGEVQEQLDVGLGFVNVFLLVFAGIALLVASLLILNTFSILVAQRSRELALLRAIGATRAQVRNSVLLEALLIALFGATFGLLVGYGLTWAILAAIQGIGIDLGPIAPTITWQAVVASYGLAVVITMAAALLPARRASATRPVEALAAAAQSGPEKIGGLPLLGVALAEVGAAAIACAVWLAVPEPLVWLGVGATALLVGVVIAAAVVGAPVIWAFGRLLGPLFGEVGKLARLNSVRQPRRTAATAATLMIGLALVSTVAILAASTTESLTTRLSADQRGDFLIAPVAYEPFDAKVADEARAVDGVETVFEFYRGVTEVQGFDEPTTLFSATREGIERGTSLEILAGALAAEGDAQPAVIATQFATEHGLGIGQMLTLVGPAGEAEVLITGIHNEGAAFTTGQIIVTPETYAQVNDTSLVQTLVVFDEPDADTDAVRAGLQDAVAQLPTVAVSDVHEYTQARIDQFGQVFSMIYALLALAVIISVLGIVNTLGLSVMERTREVGLLRAVGLTRGQLRLMVTLESVMVATLGALLGVLLGLVFGSSLVTLLRDDGIDILAVPWLQLALFVVGAAALGVLAAVGPARRAAKLNVLDAIATD